MTCTATSGCSGATSFCDTAAAGGLGACVAPLPAPPTGVTATNLAPRYVRISWIDASSDETGFTVERALGGAAYSAAATLPANSVFFNETAILSDGTRYNYRVRSFNAAGTSAWVETGITTIKAPSAIPTNLRAVQISQPSAATVRLTWTDNGDDELQFRIMRASGNPAASSFTSLAVVPANTTTTTVGGMLAGQGYTFAVRAENGGPASANSGTAGVTIPNAGTLGGYPPTNLEAVQVAPTTIRLRWEDNSAETRFDLQRSINGAAFGAYQTLPPNDAGYDDTAVNIGNSYAYRVSGFNTTFNIGTGPSNDASPVPLGAPANLVAAPSTGAPTTSLVLNWTDTQFNETGFTIQQRIGAGGWGPATPAAASPGAVTATITALSPDTEYGFRIKATNSESAAAWSGIATARTRATAAPTVVLPEAPTALTAIALSTTSIGLDWVDNSDNETAFNIENSTDGVNFTDYFTSSTGNIISVDDVNLNSGATHHYRVRAKNAAGFSAFTNVASATTRSTTAPLAPSSLTATVISSSVVRLQFINTASDVEGFDIQASSDGTNWSADFGGINSTIISVTALTPATPYYFRVRGYNHLPAGGRNHSAFSNVAGPVTTSAGGQTILRFANAGSYPIVSLIVDGTEHIARGQGIGVGTPAPTYDVVTTAGSHPYKVVVGFWNGNERFDMYNFSGTSNAVAANATTVTIVQPTIGALLTIRNNFAATYWRGHVWRNGAAGTQGYCFNSSGQVTKYYIDGVSQGAGAAATVTSYPRPGTFTVNFHLGDPNFTAKLDETSGYFFFRNGPTDWPLVQYYVTSQACP